MARRTRNGGESIVHAAMAAEVTVLAATSAPP